MNSTLEKKHGFSYAKYGYLFSIPFIVAFLIFNLYPTIYTIVLGFTDSKGLGNITFHILKDDPFKNFRAVLNAPTFKTAVKNTFVLWTMNFIPQITLALLLTAWFTSRRNQIRGQGFFKVVFYMPNIITAASVAILFNVLFGYPKGPINDLLVQTGLRDSAFYFMNSPKATRWIVAFIQFWMWYGYTMIILISGVLGINPEIFEAAEIDGATDTQIFFQITLPNLRTILTYTLVTSLIGGLSMYDIPKMLNNGNPNNATLTANMFIYNQAFQGSYLYARAAAASMIMFVIIAFFSAIVFYLMRDRK
ncbi:MAG: sugar ABC transporter permease [Oscillospiraceae bacterium]|nr:sugar ABC transporter permease [Oscillospiraceae bacterium]